MSYTVTPESISGDRITLRLLRPEDVSEVYLRWMNDKEITRFLESRWTTFTIEKIRQYVESANGGETERLFGIYENSTNRHIGNIKIGLIDRHHNTADLGLIIGERDATGKGIGTEAIRLASHYAKRILGLRKIIAGSYAANIASIKAFKKAGFVEIGRLKDHYVFEGGYTDGVLLEINLEKEEI